MLDKSFFRERWFKILEDEYLKINSYITDKGWRILCSKPDNGCEGLAQEFYANAYTMPRTDDKGSVDLANLYSSFVRGKEINFSLGMINSLFELIDTYNFAGECHSHI